MHQNESDVHYQKDRVWVDEELKYNPREYKFYIKVIDDNGREHSIWNDYFYSTEESRESKLNDII